MTPSDNKTFVSSMSRRRFLRAAGLGVAAGALPTRRVLAKDTPSSAGSASPLEIPAGKEIQRNMSARKLKLKDSPRLYVSEDIANHLKDKLHSAFLQAEAKRVLRDADQLVRTEPLKEGSGPSYMGVTRTIDSHLRCLTCAWVLTGETRYRKAAIRHLGTLLTFDHISCEATTATPADVKLPFCLTYGELSATVGLMYDLFRRDLAGDERQVFFAVLDRFLLRQALQALSDPPWWAFQDWSNWNGVCAGGMGIMALAFYDDIPAARRLIPFVERSLGEYFKSYIADGGGCHEGTGYWNYGMSYAVRYLLSWEHATGKKHPAMKIKQLAQSLWFPLDFNGISFGDNDHWGPAGFFFLFAKRTNQPNAALVAAARLLASARAKAKPRRHGRAATGDLLYAADCLPSDKAVEKFRQSHEDKPVPTARIYKGLGWGLLADDEAFPRLRLAVRGGSSEVRGHGMLDLLSFRCRVNGELMITDQQDGGYMPTTFTDRGQDIYGRSAASKSTLFVDGLGCAINVQCDKTEIVKGEKLLGVRLDASHVYMPTWDNLFVGRLVLMVDSAYWLVIDHVRGANTADAHWMESRFHTLAECEAKKTSVALTSGDQPLQMTFAALNPGVLQEATGMPSQPSVQRTTIFRWMTERPAWDNLHVTALNPGAKKLALAIRRDKPSRYTIEVTGEKGYRRTIGLTPTLKLSTSS